MQAMEPIIDYLKRRLKEVGAKQWPAIAAEINKNLLSENVIGEPLLRKIAYGDRENPGIKTIQPLIEYFQLMDRNPTASTINLNTTDQERRDVDRREEAPSATGKVVA